MGGAQAIGALAYGTETIRAWTRSSARATPGSRRPSSRCWTGAPSTCRPDPPRSWSWPTTSADPVHVAADLLSEAEHGADSPVVLVTHVGRLADAIEAELALQLPRLERRRRSWPPLSRGTIVRGRHGRRGARLRRRVRARAPLLLVADDEAALRTLRHAGSLFLGGYSPEAAGDYATGSNHVLPTAGAGARLQRALGRVVRTLDAGPAPHPGRARVHPGQRRGGRGGRGPDRAPSRRGYPLRRRRSPTPTPGGPTLMAAPAPAVDRRPPAPRSTPGSRRAACSPPDTASSRRTSCAST